MSGPVETINLPDSFHVATLDHDADLINRKVVAQTSVNAGRTLPTAPAMYSAVVSPLGHSASLPLMAECGVSRRALVVPRLTVLGSV